MREKFGQELTSVGAIGISAMMHGYMAFNKEGKLLAPFRTWRNTITEEASEKLTELFQFTIPRDGVLPTCTSVFWKGGARKGYGFYDNSGRLCSLEADRRKVLGVGDASGMFPIDSATGTYYADMVEKFDG